MLVAFRFLSDFLWNFKIVSAVWILFLVIFASLVLVLRLKKTTMLKFDKQTFALFLGLFILFTLSLLKEPNIQSLTVYIKILIVLCIFFYSFYQIEPIYLEKFIIEVSSLFLLIVLLVMFVLGIGFVSWGAASTFSGNYFFKTDLAAAVSIIVSFLLFSRLSFPIKLIIYVLGFVLVYSSNARVYYLIYSLIGLIYYYRINIFNVGSIFKIRYLIFCALSIVIIFSIASYFSSSDKLLFSFKDGLFSDRNLQGRGGIWLSIITGYINDFSFIEKLIGGGLLSDRELSVFWKNDDIHAHNTFLYLLVSVGVIGLVLFLLLIKHGLNIFKQVCVSRNGDYYTDYILFMFLVFNLVLIVGGLTNTTIVFIQTSFGYFWALGKLNKINNENLNAKKYIIHS